MAALGPFDNLGDTARHDATTAGRVGGTDRLLAVDNAAGREIGTLNELQQIVELGVGVVDQVDFGVDQFGQVVRRDIGGHTDGDTELAVQQ